MNISILHNEYDQIVVSGKNEIEFRDNGTELKRASYKAKEETSLKVEKERRN